jgi:TM2 domain-containing membrane protein YozV
MEIIDENGNTVNKNPNNIESKRVIAGILGILLSPLGIHKFILGYKKEGLIMLLVSVLTCGIGAGVMGIIGLIEGIIYLTKSDEEFIETYQINHKGWF